MEYFYGSISAERKLDEIYLLERNKNFKTRILYDFLNDLKTNPSYDEEYDWISVKISKKELNSLKESNLTILIEEYFNKYNCELFHLDLFRKFSL